MHIFSIISLESLISESFYSLEILHFTYPILFVKLVFLEIQWCRYIYREKELKGVVCVICTKMNVFTS